MTLSPETMTTINSALFAGRKIEAIKVYREATGLGLKEAKDFIDDLEARLREEEPGRFATSNGAGCAGVLLAVALLVAGAAALVGS